MRGGLGLAERFHLAVAVIDIQAVILRLSGYRSHFIPMAELEGFETHVAYVTAWLEHAAQSPDWQHHVENRRQGDLFDP